ncbi:MAG: polyphosphate kinase 2 family protein [Gemmatimonadaceae bacterium]
MALLPLPFLRPVSARASLRLSDRDAKPDPGVLRGETLKAELERELKKLTELQNVFYADARYALLVVLQGRDASGKDGTIRSVFGACNPQGCQVTSFKAPTAQELAHDYLWRVHNAIPPKSIIGIFNRSHYEDVLVVRVKGLVPRSVWKTRYEQINAFERHLFANGVVILKFFLHISKAEQQEQFLERLTDPKKNWKFRAADLDDRALWGHYTRAYRDALRRCSTPWAPWYVVPSDSKTMRNYLVTRVINEALEKMDLRYPRAAKEVLALKERLGG